MSTALAASLSEEDLQRHVVNLANMHGWMVYHTYDSRHSAKGFPDLVMVRAGPCKTPNCDGSKHPTEAVILELKNQKRKVEPEQEAWLDLLRRLPGVKFAGVIRPSQWFAGELDDVLR